MRTRSVWTFGSSALLVLALMPGPTAAASAHEIYRCRDAQGRIAYQDHPCARAMEQTRIEPAAPPPLRPSPAYATASSTPARRTRVARPPTRASERVSWECRADNGEVFYRHSGCPGSVRTDSARRGARNGGAAGSVRVSATRKPRSEVCRALAAAGSIGRSGRERDERVSTYDRNAGRDPCRHF